MDCSFLWPSYCNQFTVILLHAIDDYRKLVSTVNGLYCGTAPNGRERHPQKEEKKKSISLRLSRGLEVAESRP